LDEAGHVPDTWERGSPYERYIGRWSRQVAPVFLAWLGIAPGRRWLDVGCGTGALCAAIIDACAPSSVIGVEPSAGFRALAAQSLGNRVALREGTATSLPLADASVDATVSGLVLNFVPDLPAALAEMSRVTVPGGTIAAYVWDYADKMELIRLFWDAASELDPEAAKLHEGVRFPLCHPDALVAEFRRAGLRESETAPIDVPTRFASFDDYWSPLLGGQGPAPAYVMALSEDARIRLRERIRARLPVASDGSLRLTARAWAIRGATEGAAQGR
jgi:SAM-dependent methyltransferase